MATLERPIGQTPTLAPAKTPTGWAGWLTTVDHKKIGIMYLVSAFFFFIVGGIEALLMRVQLGAPNNTFLSPDVYNQMFTMHATTMIFLAIMPLNVGFGNYVVPIMIGARDMAFPRLNALSIWLFIFGGLMLYSSFILGGAPGAGWFSYAPLSEKAFSPTHGVDYWVIGLTLAGVASIAGGVNFIVTIINMRAPGMTFNRMPLFVWMTLVTSFLLVFAFPSLTVAQVQLLFDRNFGTHFFLPDQGGDPLLWQHLFWFFGHPEVYILILPAMGIISEVLPTFSRKPIFGYAFVAYSGVAIGFVAMFIIGGISGITLASPPIDLQQTDTYYVVAHIHYVLFGGSIFGLFAAAFYWFPKITGRMLNDGLGKLQFWLMLISFNITFFPMHILGTEGMPRRYYTYEASMGWDFWNLLETIGAFAMAFSVLLFIINVVNSLRSGEQAPADPWDGATLEWSASSPPLAHNFDRTPVVHSRRPLWDSKYPDLEVAHAPGAHSQTRRERIERDTVAEHAGEEVIHMPSSTYAPLIVAFGLTVAAYGGLYLSSSGGLSAIASLVGFAIMGYGIVRWVRNAHADEPH
jgi:heme/copper-type cytochrome/quinol oxidase subunit 1